MASRVVGDSEQGALVGNTRNCGMERDQFYEEARSDLTGPLAGLRVLEAATTWSGPMAGCLLADMGAEVIKVELPAGDVTRIAPPHLPGTTLSFAHQTVNRNKRSLSLDLRTGPGQAIFLELASTHDVVIENFLPGTLAGWGLGYHDVRRVRQDIVYLSITGWGQFGELAPRPAYDPAVQAASGWMSLNGDPDGLPVRAPTFLADDLAGLHGALAVLAALRHRDASGEGQHLDVALLDATLYQSNGYLTLGAMGADMPRLGSQVPVAVPCNTYRGRDGAAFIALILDTHWDALVDLMDRADLAADDELHTNAGRVARRADVNEAVAEWFAGLEVDEAVQLAAEAGVAVSPVHTFGEVAELAHVAQRQMLQRVQLEDGTEAPIVGPAAKFSRTPTFIRRAARALGIDGPDVLRELGYGESAIEGLRAEGVI